jgi:hypothetical protein
MSPRLLPALVIFAAATLHAADFKRIPPPGIAIPDADRAELSAGVDALRKDIDAAKLDARELPNVEIFLKAVDWALRYDEFFDAKQVAIARDQLAQGHARLDALKAGKAPWNQASGLVVRAYRSAIDGSVQPYGLVIPATWKPDDGKKWRLDFWLHGRGEKLSELAFIDDRQKNKGEFAPDEAIVCHLYGRFCNANKFAGERDLFETLDDLKQHYAIDEQRLVVRGFSMGGASTWQFATHHADMWAAAAPGAGFAETAEFFHVFAPGKTPPPWWEQVLWRWYDCTTMAANLANTKVVAYSGEIDGQKQAADIMTKYAAQEGLEFPHIIGPQTGHKYHPEAKPKIEELVSAAAGKGKEKDPKEVRLVTYSLIYPRVAWVTIEGFEKQWERAEVAAKYEDDGGMTVTTKNVSSFNIGGGTTLPNTPSQRLPSSCLKIVVDGQVLDQSSRRLWSAELNKIGGKWRFGMTMGGGPVTPLGALDAKQWPIDRTESNAEAAFALQKRRGKKSVVCGPIDHAFMSRFIFVRPTGTPLNPEVGAWAKAEMDHAIEFWRRVFRGDAPVKDDTAITADDIQNANLILWGDPSSNQVLKKMSAMGVNPGGHKNDPLGLPYQWSADTLLMSGVKYDAHTHVPILIFPNPLNPSKYLVLNSGVTFRERALLNNSDQTPKLPDWAIVDLRTPPDDQWPGQIVDAGFFDEQWGLGKR